MGEGTHIKPNELCKVGGVSGLFGFQGQVCLPGVVSSVTIIKLDGGGVTTCIPSQIWPLILNETTKNARLKVEIGKEKVFNVAQ